jgi:3-phosphoglycerate kinase
LFQTLGGNKVDTDIKIQWITQLTGKIQLILVAGIIGIHNIKTPDIPQSRLR